MRKLLFTINAMWIMPLAALALWAEPSCDPAVDPTTCNISAPLNVSSSDQIKDGGLAINGTLTANGSSIFANTGTLTADGSTLIRGPLIVQNTTIFSNPYTVAVNGVFTYSGAAGSFTLTNNSIDDDEVSDTLTASDFVGTGSTSDSVDLATTEVFGMLPASSVEDVWVNTTSDTMTGTLTLTPSSAVTALSITPQSTAAGIAISGSSSQPLISLNQTGSTAPGLYVNLTSGSADGIGINTVSPSTGRGISILSQTSGIPILAVATNATQTISGSNSATNGYALRGVSTGTTSYGVGGSGTFAGIYGTSSNSSGYGGYFANTTTSGTALYTTLTSPGTTTTSKALEVAGKNGYGGYFTTTGGNSTTIYAENTGTTGLTNYAIHAKTAPSMWGTTIYAEADVGTAGYFISGNGGTAISAANNTGIGLNVLTTAGGNGIAVTTTAGGNGINVSTNTGNGININTSDISATGIVVNSAGTAIDVTVSSDSVSALSINVPASGRAIEANNGTIHSEGSYEGGQFYPNDYSTTTGFANNEPNKWNITSLAPYYVTDVIYSGNELVIGTNNSTVSGRIYLVDSTTGQKTAMIDHGFILDSVEVIVRDNYIYAFNLTSDEYFRYDRLTGTSTSGTTGSTAYPSAVVYDGERAWIGTDSSIQSWTFAGSPVTRQSGLNPISDIIIADDYIWASSAVGNVIYKMQRASPYTLTTISTGSYSPGDLEFDGQYIWATSGGRYLIRVNIADNSVDSVDAIYSSQNPQSIVFDGVNIWIGYENYVRPWNIAEQTFIQTAELINTGINPEVFDLVFDGTYVWALFSSTGGSIAYQLPSGASYGTGMPLVRKGLLMYNPAGTVVCLYISGTATVSASTTLTNCQ